jgi:hypothetical protein
MEISPKKIIKNLKVTLEGFNHHEENLNKISSDFYIWFLVCSHKYKKLIKNFVLYIWFIARVG